MRRNEDDSMVERARKLAYKVHKGQHRWGGEPFIVHPKGVVDKLIQMKVTMLGRICRENVTSTDESILTVGWLHDVVEDTSVRLGKLLTMGFSADVVNAVDAISRQDGEDYLEYIKRVRANPIARIVKIADIEHNLESFDHKKSKSRADKYKLAIEVLKQGV